MKIYQKIINHHPIIFTFFGAIFGFLLSRSGATDYDYYAKLFIFEDYQLIYVIGFAALTAMLGLQIVIRLKLKTVANNTPIIVAAKKKQRGSYFGAIIFGTGWALTGSCPGTLPAMIGQGQVSAAIVFMGVFFGIWIYAKTLKRF